MTGAYGQSFGDPGYSSGDVQRRVNVDLDSDVSGFVTGMQQATAQAQQFAQVLTGVGQQVDSIAKRAGKTLMHFSIGDFAGLSAAVGVAARFEHQLSTMNATAAITGANMNQMKSQLSGVFSQFPVWREQVVQLATAINSMGVKTPQGVGTLTASYTKLGAATGEDPTALASSGISLAKQMGTLDPSRINQYNNALVTLSKNAGVSAQSITDFASALAPFARQAGIGEGAVMGISAAFQKVGADGQIAANAFSQLLSNITQLKQAGGDVSKYSGFLGISRQQFSAMNPLQAATSLFQRIGQGGPAATAFTQDLGGIRAQAVIQRVAQSGDLASLTSMGRANTTGTSNLDKSAAAAFSGLTDSLTSVRNEFTQLAELIGAPLLGPLKTLADLLAKAVSGLNSFLGALGPLPAIIATAAGAAAVPAAFGLAHAGLATAAGTARYAFGKNAGWRQAFSAGRSVAGAMAGGMSEADAMMADPFGQRFTNNQLPSIAGAAFLAGRRAGPTNSGSGGPSWWQSLTNSQFGQTIAGAWSRGQGRPGPTPGAPPTPGGGGGGGGGAPGWLSQFANVTMSGANWVYNGQNDPLRHQGTRWYNRPAYQAAAGQAGAPPPGSPAAQLLNNIITTPGLLGSSLLSSAGAGARGAAGALPNTGWGLFGKAGLHAAGGLATGASWLAKGATGLLGAVADNPLLMLAGTLGYGAVSSLAQRKEDQIKFSPEQMSGAAGKYDQLLDKTSSNLAKFGEAASDATDKLTALADVPLGKVGQIGQSDIDAITSGSYKMHDTTLGALISKSPQDDASLTKNILAYLGSTGVQAPDMAGDQGTAIKQDLLAGLSPKRRALAQSILNTFIGQMGQPGGPAAGADYTGLGTVALNTGNADDFKSILGQGRSGIVAATQNVTGKAGRLPQIVQMLQMGGAASAGADSGQQKRIQSVIDMLSQQYTGLDPMQMLLGVGKAGQAQGSQTTFWDRDTWGGSHQGVAPFSTGAQGTLALATAFADSAAGKTWLDQNHISRQELLTAVQAPMPLPAQTPTNTNLLGTLGNNGQLGARLAGLGSIRSAVGSPENLGRQQAAVQATLQAALGQAGRGPTQGNDAAAIIRRAAEGTSGALHDLMEAAAAAADNTQSLASVNFSPLQVALGQISAGQAKIAAGTAPGATTEEAGQVDTGRGMVTSGQQALQGYAQGVNERGRQFIISSERSQQDFGTQRRQFNQAYTIQQQRAQYAYGVQVSRSQRDFGIQQQRQEYEFGVQRARSQRDFDTQQTRASEQYYRSRFRQVRDFGIQEARAEDQFQVSRTRQVRDYNTQRTRQERDFHKQQGRELEEYNINRGREEYQYQLDRSRQIADFNTQQQHALRDFHTQQTREVEHYQVSAARSERDFLKSRQRAQEDFATQMKRQAEQTAQTIYDPWSRISRKSTIGGGNLLRNLTQQNAAIQKQIANLKKAKELGISEQTIQELDLANPANAQELDQLVKSLAHNPTQIAQINQQVSQRVKGTTDLTQTADNLSYKNAMEDFLKDSQRAWEDYKTSVQDGAQDLATAMKEQYQDFTTQTSDAQKEQQKNLQRSAADHKTTMHNEEVDFHRTTLHESQDFITSLTDNWKDLNTSLSDGLADFKKQTKQAKDDLKTALSDGAIDFETQMGQSVHDFKTTMADQQADFETNRANAAADQKRTLGDMASDFATTTAQAATDHGIALQQMTTAYKTQQTRAGEDLKESFHTYTTGLSTSLVEMTQMARGKLAEFGPQAVSDYINTVISVANALGLTISGIPTGATPGGPPGYTHSANPTSSSVPSDTHYDPTHGSVPGYASGGISLNKALAMVSETGPELHLPLDQSGEKFMTKLMSDAAKNTGGILGTQFASPVGIGKNSFNEAINRLISADVAIAKRQEQAMAMQANASTQGQHKIVAAIGHLDLDLTKAIVKDLGKEIVQGFAQVLKDERAAVQRNDNSTSFAGAHIKVVADDPAKMAKAIQQKAKLNRLVSPVRHG